MVKWVFRLLLLPIFGFAQNTLTISVEGVKSADGNISIGLYTDSEGFLKPDQLYKGVFQKATKGTTIAHIEDLPKGTYAIAVFHDENANQELDTNFFGIPKEALGFSKGKLKTFGPPSFEECTFEFPLEQKLTIKIK